MASLHGPSGFSLASILTASGGNAPRTRESCARAGSVRNGIALPAVIMAAIRPKLRRENPRLTKSRIWWSDNRFCIEFPLRLTAIAKSVAVRGDVRNGESCLIQDEPGGAIRHAGD